jgi:hypothetical protein
LILAVAIGWGVWQRNRLTRAEAQISDEGARLLREHGGDKYEREDRPRLEKKLAEQNSSDGL